VSQWPCRIFSLLCFTFQQRERERRQEGSSFSKRGGSQIAFYPVGHPHVVLPSPSFHSPTPVANSNLPTHHPLPRNSASTARMVHQFPGFRVARCDRSFDRKGNSRSGLVPVGSSVSGLVKQRWTEDQRYPFSPLQ